MLGCWGLLPLLGNFDRPASVPLHVTIAEQKHRADSGGDTSLAHNLLAPCFRGACTVPWHETIPPDDRRGIGNLIPSGN